MKTFTLLAIAVSLFISHSATFGETVTFDKLPKAVQETAEKELGKNFQNKAKKVVVDKTGDATFEIKFKSKTDAATLTISETGKLLEKVQDVAARELPKAVIESIKKDLGEKATILKAERTTKDNANTYSLRVNVESKDFQVAIAEDGKITKKKETAK